ncbi:hypothetical protein AAFF_G00132360 [Aldrovandia affinis]|uniref:CW-type domain-containing protein n=1 Tax=Aldrovandia affinis TaxID=143900 RepID=A0AAD7RQV9_9TELE|nr:hypothetical protein AAFF_G00132360 [Aldrovandia affinis]
MARESSGNIPLSAVNPQYLNANSTSHKWPFGAFAELIDNAYDPDVNAKHLWIDWTRTKNLDCLIFMDNGKGMDYDKMHKMLSFGFSEKRSVKGHVPVGLYGNGFKSGSMRLGKDAIVFSKDQASRTIGLLSQSYLAAIRAQNVVVPIVTFRPDGTDKGKYILSHAVPEHADSLNAILEHSLFQTEADLHRELEAIDATHPKGSTGTRIIIWNLRSTSTQPTEFDFETDRYDIRIPRMDLADVPDPNMDRGPLSTYSLCAYCSILYLRPRMQIIIRGQKVRTQLVSKSLAYTNIDRYTPKFLKKGLCITFGYNPINKDHYAEGQGCGNHRHYQCDFLKPTHDKQDFDDTEEYRKIKYTLGVKLEEYWKERDFRKKDCTVPVEDIEKTPDQNWVKCDNCQKWRKLPDGIDSKKLPEEWFCHLNPDPQYRSCQVEEEREDSEDEQPYQKTYKQQEKNRKQQQKTIGDTGPTPVDSAVEEETQDGTNSSQGLPVISNVCSMGQGRGLKKRARTNSRQNSISEDVDDAASLDLCPPLMTLASDWALEEGSMETETMAMAASPASPARQPVSAGTQTEMKLEGEDVWQRDGSVAEAEPLSAGQGAGGQGEAGQGEAGQGAGEAGRGVDPEGGEHAQLRVLQKQQDELLEMLQEAAQERDKYREQASSVMQERCETEGQEGEGLSLQVTSIRRDLQRTSKERDELKSKLESLEVERGGLSSQVEQLKRELEAVTRGTQSAASGCSPAERALSAGSRASGSSNETQRLRNLRLNVSRILVTVIPELDLDQVNYESNVIDEILDQFLDGIS